MKSNILKFVWFSTMILIFSKCSNEFDLVSTQQVELKVKISSVLENPNGRTDAVIVQPSPGTYYSGSTMLISWSFITCCGDWTSSKIHLDLYQGSNFISRIASNFPFFDYNSGGNKYSWLIPPMALASKGFKIRITNTANSNQIAESENFSILIPNGVCYYSYWTLSGQPTYLYGNYTVPYKINESGMAQQSYANAPVIRIISYSPINVIYNGTTYYCPGASGVNIPINSSANCVGTNPTISAPITYQKIGGSGTTVIVTINSVSSGHSFDNSYHTYSIY